MAKKKKKKIVINEKKIRRRKRLCYIDYCGTGLVERLGKLDGARVCLTPPLVNFSLFRDGKLGKLANSVQGLKKTKN